MAGKPWLAPIPGAEALSIIEHNAFVRRRGNEVALRRSEWSWPGCISGTRVMVTVILNNLVPV